MARKNSKRKFDYQLDINTGLYRIHALRNIGSLKLGFLIEADSYGGLIDDPNLLSQKGECWIDKNAIVINTNINDDCYVGGEAYVKNSALNDAVKVFKNAKIEKSILTGNIYVRDNVKILNNCVLNGTMDLRNNTILASYVNITGKNLIFKENARVTGPITINQDNIILKENIDLDMESNLLLRFGLPSVNKRYKCYKIVRSTDIDHVYESIYNKEFKYDLRKSKTIKVKYYNKNKNIICGDGIHVAFTEDFNWGEEMISKADKILTCWIYPKDIIAFDKNTLKARVSKIYVTKVRDYPILYNEKSIIKVTHKLNTRNIITYVYNNKSSEAFYDYIVTATSESTAAINFKITTNDSLDNYNIVMLGSRDLNNIVARPPQFYKTIILGDNVHNVHTIEHNLKSKHVMVILYNNNTYEDITNEFRVIHLDENNIVLDPMRLLYKNESYTMLILKPTFPTFIGIASERGLANITPYHFTKIFMGHDIDRNDNSITVTHEFNRFDVFGRVMDNETKEYIHTDDYIFRRTDENNVKILFKKRIYQNHQYIVFLSKC